jgi:ribonuclease E
MLDAVSADKARIEVGRLSRFGLMEMSRQRLRASLSSQSTVPCSHCRGTGKFKSHEIVALEALRKIQSAVIVGHVTTVKTRLSGGAALFLLNNKKWELAQLEKEHNVRVLILADGRLRPDEVQFEMETAEPETAKTPPVSASSSDDDSGSKSGRRSTNKRGKKRTQRKPRKSSTSKSRASKDGEKKESADKKSEKASSDKSESSVAPVQ